MRAMPIAAPISRTVSLSAEATPCLSSVSDEVMAVVEAAREADAGADEQQAGEDGQVAAVGVGERGG